MNTEREKFEKWWKRQHIAHGVRGAWGAWQARQSEIDALRAALAAASAPPSDLTEACKRAKEHLQEKFSDDFPLIVMLQSALDKVKST